MMNNMIKKMMIYALVGMMQLGFAATVTEAASFRGESVRRINMDNRERRHDEHNERKRQHDERKREENERHEREMRRRQHENEHEWRERQARENERHDAALHDIALLLVGVAIGAAAN